ncbi:hypothetical protein F0562_034515 [Nyssa sinensis]|uniref:Uncharacterized protein n=1 Tax=Nyssa sinensis TaxID=561372 RepID=A0A5J5AJ52_9ASTE|nr:hypothetical protein F0562_034515 [Nyssa sinensis]
MRRSFCSSFGENDPPLSSINDALRMAWDLSWDKIPRELAQVSISQAVHCGFVFLCRALHIMAALGEIRYESHDLEAQLQFQLMSSIKAVNKVEELKKRLEKVKMLEMFVVKTAASKTEARHYSEIKVAKVAKINEQKDKILKLERKLASDGYNPCFKRITKAFSKIDIEVLDHVEVYDVESKDFEKDEVYENPATPTDP